MEERRFDELTRNLGRATSRRQVVKGLLGGLGAALLGRVRAPAPAEAANGTCSSQTFQTCMAAAKAQYESLNGHCGTTDGPPWAGSLCSVAASAWYSRAINQCQAATQCPPGMSCFNNRCCRGADCCEQGQIHCGSGGVNGTGGTCCPAGSTCCESGCCPAEKTCCLNYSLTLFNPSASQVCTDLQSDADNCGACRHKCNGLPCVDGTCQCASGDVICKGPLNQTCCHPNERCQISPITFGVACVPACLECETYDTATQSCKPLDCGACQTCVSGSCQPAADNTECGSNLVCQQGQCVAACTDVCKVFQNGQCVSAPDGTVCDPGSGFQCCRGQCDLFPGQPCCDEASQEICGDTCCPDGQGCSLVLGGSNHLICCPADENGSTGDALPGDICCNPGETGFHRNICPTNPDDTWVCCPISTPGLYGCCDI